MRDESDRTGMRIVIELRRDVNPNVVLNNLYKHTAMQSTFGINMIAIVNNEPKLLTLKEVLSHYLQHQIEVIRRRTEFDLKKPKPGRISWKACASLWIILTKLSP